MNDHLDKAFSPATLGKLTLKNRIIKAATYEGKTPDGTRVRIVTAQLVREPRNRYDKNAVRVWGCVFNIMRAHVVAAGTRLDAFPHLLESAA